MSSAGGFYPGKLWSLWDMISQYGDLFFLIGRASSVMKSVLVRKLDRQSVAEKLIGLEPIPTSREEFIEDILRMTEASDVVDLRVISPQIERVRELNSKKFGRWEVIARRFNRMELIKEFDAFLHRIEDTLHNEYFLHVPQRLVKYYQKDHLFGVSITNKFSMMTEDISEAGKCLALGRPTAAIFHLMRVMEIAVQRFGDKLGIALASEKNWQNILDEINKAIKLLDPKAPQTKAYAGASAHLYNVKLRWRNEVMHPKQTYTPDEATEIFGAVETFIRDLAEIL